MRLLITADLHFNHAHSRPLAEKLIQQMNATPADVLLVAGDTAVADGDSLEQCLSLFQFTGPKLLIPGNHELWTNSPDSYRILHQDLPRRCQALGWYWLMKGPYMAGDIAIVGSLGWYDSSFAPDDYKIPTTARWNDARNVKLGRSDEQFLNELLAQLESQLIFVAAARTVVAAVHCIPFQELLPPPHGPHWEFIRAHLGSRRIGQLLQRFPNVHRVYCGHSHFAAEAKIGNIQAINIGSGYRAKRFRVDEIE